MYLHKWLANAQKLTMTAYNLSRLRTLGQVRRRGSKGASDGVGIFQQPVSGSDSRPTKRT
jgi:hypothetical protein